MRKAVLILCCFNLLSLSVSASALCPSLTAFLPQQNNIEVKCFTDYVVAIDKRLGQPLAAVYIVNRDEAITSHFRRDIGLGDDVASLRRQQQAHQARYDYAHLANEKIKDTVVQERFNDANRVPMHPSVNRKGGPWHQLEIYELEQARKIGRLIVIAGVQTGSQIPNALYKIYLQPDIAAVNAYLIPNNGEAEGGAETLMSSVHCIEEMTDIEFNIPWADESLKRSKAFSMSLFTQGGSEVSCGSGS